jgi:hypothetical protein
MDVEREILDIYRSFYMIDHIGETFEGTVSAFVGSGAFVTLDEPFVRCPHRTEDLGADWTIEDDGLMATSRAQRRLASLGDRLLVTIVDVALLRRQVTGRRVPGDDERTRPTRPDGRHAKPARRDPFGKKARVATFGEGRVGPGKAEKAHRARARSPARARRARSRVAARAAVSGLHRVREKRARHHDGDAPDPDHEARACECPCGGSRPYASARIAAGEGKATVGVEVGA